MNTRLHPGRCSPCLTGTFVFLLARRYSPPQLRSPFPLQSLITVFFHRRPPPTVSQPVGAESATPVAERPGESDLLSSDEEPDSQGPLYAADSQPMGIPTASEGIPKVSPIFHPHDACSTHYDRLWRFTNSPFLLISQA